MARRPTKQKQNTKVNENEVKENTKVENIENPKEEEVKKEALKTTNTKSKKSIQELDVNTPAYVEHVLSTAKTLDELLDNLVKSPLTRTIASRLKLYREVMSKPIIKAEEGAGKNYDLYTAIIQVAKNPDYNQFQLQFKVINKAFLLGKDDVFNPIMLSRFDYLWRWGLDSKQNYERLVELISILANPKNKNMLDKTISLDAALNGLPEVARENINRFYRVG